MIDLSNSSSEPIQCHLMPCRIEHNQSTIKAKEYFWPTIQVLGDCSDYDEGREKIKRDNTCRDSDKSNKDVILTASFRGRPLQGRKVKLPDGYIGHVHQKDSVDGRKFDEFTYWNWDQIPKDNDTVVNALQWMKIAQAIHDS